ncbi:MAG: hypothetical protein N4A72_15540 [Bacteroidales bacterium]|jgi:hypothetical protein|nr:hypothetical protein [Bacteroidales bacterium]
MIKALTLPTPNCRLELAEGGSLEPNQTYYIIGYFSRFGGYYGQWHSAVQDELSITTTDTKRSIRVIVGYNNEQGEFVAGAPAPEGLKAGYKFKWDKATMKDENGEFYKWLNPNTNAGSESKGHNRWSHIYHTDSRYYSDFILTELNEGSGYQSYSNFHPQISSGYIEESCFLQTYDRDRGNLLIYVKDDTYDFNDLCTALKEVDAELYHTGNKYVDFYGSLYDKNGTLKLDNVQIHQYFGNIKSSFTEMSNCNHVLFDPFIWCDLNGKYNNSDISTYGSVILKSYNGNNNFIYKKDNRGYLSTYGSAKELKLINNRFAWSYPKAGYKLENFEFVNSWLLFNPKTEGAELHDILFHSKDTGKHIQVNNKTKGDKHFNFYNVNPAPRIEYTSVSNGIITIDSFSRHNLVVENLPEACLVEVHKDGEFFKTVQLEDNMATFDILRDKHASLLNGKDDITSDNSEYTLVITSPYTAKYVTLVGRLDVDIKVRLSPAKKTPVLATGMKATATDHLVDNVGIITNLGDKAINVMAETVIDAGKIDIK